MKLTDKWFTALSENEKQEMVVVRGREELEDFKTSGKLKERVEVTWSYTPAEQAMPSTAESDKMEEVEAALRKVMEKDKLAILTSIYTGGGEKIWVFYTRALHVFGERFNEALAAYELLPLRLYTEKDEAWEEYSDMLEMKQWALD